MEIDKVEAGKMEMEDGRMMGHDKFQHSVVSVIRRLPATLSIGCYSTILLLRGDGKTIFHDARIHKKQEKENKRKERKSKK